jgi:transcriptional regulator with XRE-family HTH domain
MKKSSESGKQIRELRDGLGLKQLEFAERLGVTQATISSWEAGDEDRAPSAEAYFRLAGLASYPKNLWFLKQAGIEAQAILSLADKILEERSAPPKPGEVVRIERFRVTPEGREETGQLVALPGEFIPNRDSTKCFILDGKSASFVFADGDIVVVDASDVESRDLALTSFFDKIVLMEFNAERLHREMPYYRSPEGLFIGKLGLQKSGTFSWEARLAPLDERFKVHAVVVGEWRYDYRDDSNPPRYRGQDLDRAEKLVPEEIRLYPACRIVGAVVGWFTKSVMQKH